MNGGALGERDNGAIMRKGGLLVKGMMEVWGLVDVMSRGEERWCRREEGGMLVVGAHAEGLFDIAPLQMFPRVSIVAWDGCEEVDSIHIGVYQYNTGVL